MYSSSSSDNRNEKSGVTVEVRCPVFEEKRYHDLLTDLFSFNCMTRQHQRKLAGTGERQTDCLTGSMIQGKIINVKRRIEGRL